MPARERLPRKPASLVEQKGFEPPVPQGRYFLKKHNCLLREPMSPSFEPSQGSFIREGLFGLVEELCSGAFMIPGQAVACACSVAGEVPYSLPSRSSIRPARI